MDNAATNGTLLGVGFYLGHQIMMNFGLNLMGAVNVYRIGVGAKVGYLFRAGQPDFLPGFGQGNPQLPPGAPFVGFAPDVAHGIAAIAPGEG